MRTFWLFRSNIKALEYYHKYDVLEDFEKNCHDYYMLLPLWLLKNNYVDQVIIWRLSHKPRKDIKFEVNGKFYIQKWVRNFCDTAQHSKPDISFWRGGFREYDIATKRNPKHYGLKLYLGAGHRITPQWGGWYDVLLMEDESDFINKKRCFPFYKNASPNIFYPIANSKLEYDICWPANFSQLKHKGQGYFIKLIASDPYLRKLKIVHCGNKQAIGKKLCDRHNVKNIEFRGWLDRPSVNELLNKSKFGLNVSNRLDGCPRVSTEILMSGTPLILKDTVRLLKLYREKGVINSSDKNMAGKINFGMKHYERYKAEVLDAIKNKISFDNVNKKNIDLWNSF